MTVYRLIHAGVLPAFQIGKAFRIKPSDLESYLQGCSVKVDPDQAAAARAALALPEAES